MWPEKTAQLMEIEKIAHTHSVCVYVTHILKYKDWAHKQVDWSKTDESSEMIECDNNKASLIMMMFLWESMIHI